MSVQFINTYYGRRRFLKTKGISDLNNWMCYAAELKNFLSCQSSLQIVGEKIHFEITTESLGLKLMLEVIGLPIPFDENNFFLADLEAGNILIYKLLRADFLTLDFDQLLKDSWDLKRKLEASLKRQLKKEEELSEIFHIVFDHDKIELHFFRQKDYIQKQL